MNIGFAGLGVMGAPMASNLMHAGFPVHVYDKVGVKIPALVAQGAGAAQSLAELAARSDVVITMLPDTPDVECALFGTAGLAQGLKSGAVCIDMSTISPRATVEFARRLGGQGVEMLDAPVSGGEPGAKAARLSIMVGGPRQVYESCLPVLRAMGTNIVYTGLNGNGQKTKMVNQVIGAINLLATVEGLRLAAAAGLDPQHTLDAVSAGAAGSWMLSNLGPKILQGDFAPGFAIRLQQKDLRLACELLDELQLDAPGASLAHALFTRALEKGLGDQGNHGLINLWAR